MIMALNQVRVDDCLNDTLFDVENMPIDFIDKIPGDSNPEDWDSEDELSLVTVRLRELANRKPIWTNLKTGCPQNAKKFTDDFGPNLLPNIETPTDVFLQISPESLIDHLVFSNKSMCPSKIR